MARDILTLGGIVFDDFSTPERMPFGGEQTMVVHKLPGGSRVIDTMGPDDADIHWSGRLFGDNAYETALALDAMRRSGVTLPLTFAGQAFTVVISEFSANIERLPVSVAYDITCVISPAGAFSGVSSLGGTLLASADLAAAVALNGGALATVAPPDDGLTFVNVPVPTGQIPEFVRRLPTRLPGRPGVLWSNGGVISVS
ncbi:hypothetical protein LG047_15320 [Methylocystis sp. WRRC1]|uniref:hypothetical protein n=1 Tax=Methylocystis sp. WRRC1 TaxID=1732014 RepID=UPI001D1340C6|nr:hypothetical protein [Methylocystis sp. WRRC1]MCC3246670.1 hypothetical protein [Methylocystis sp. WRRC1]